MNYKKAGSIGGVNGEGRTFQEEARAVAWSPEGSWFLAGDSEIREFAPDGGSRNRWSTALPAWSLTVDGTGRIWAGESGQIEVFTPEGQLQDTWKNQKLFGLVTEIVVTDTDIFVADARSRWIHRFDHDRGFVNHLGDHHRKGGFHIPNGVLDFAVDLDETVVVANPGMHRVERYRADGESLGYFGRFGQHDPEGFPGCCNPTNLAIGPDGQIVVSEKAGPRVKVYDPDGELVVVVAGGETFDAACKNMDLAVTTTGLIGVVDPVGLQLVLFEPIHDLATISTEAGESS